MNIETKASPNELIFYIRDNKVCSSKVLALQVRAAHCDFEPAKKGNNHYDPFDPKSIGIVYEMINIYYKEFVNTL